MDTKSLRVEVKDAAKGEVTAVIATYDVIDSDGDVTKAGAFADGDQVLVSSYGHQSWQGALPVGKGVLRTTKGEAVFDGQFFMDTAAGADTFKTIQQLGELGQWSYGYDATKYSFGEYEGKQVRFLEELKVHEVSPVLLGAGVGTRTLSAKSNRTFSDEGEAVLAALTQFGVRAADVMAMRAGKGKGISADSAALLAQVKEQADRLAELLATTPEPSTSDDVTREYLRMVARNHRLTRSTA